MQSLSSTLIDKQKWPYKYTYIRNSFFSEIDQQQTRGKKNKQMTVWNKVLIYCEENVIWSVSNGL
jgi:hypothetical protein